MKKFYSLALLVAGAFAGVNAQQVINTPANQHSALQPHLRPNTLPSARTSNPNVNPLSFSDWVTYADAKDADWGGGVSVLGANYLFPDSTVLGNFGTYDYVWIHNIGDVLDVASPSLVNYYNPINGYNLTRSDAYSVDSMAIVYAYDRQYSNPNIVDTMIVYMYSNATSANLPSNGFIGTTASNYGTDTVTFKGMKYTYGTNMPNATGVQTFKIPLTQADTAVVYYGQKLLSTNNFLVPAGKLAAVSVVFKPGYTYALGDTLDTQLNSFYFASYEEGGANSYPLYLDCNYQASSCDYGCSFIVRTNERYNQAGNSWNGNFIPKYAFTQAYTLENHLFSYKITSPPLSVEEYHVSGMTLGQNVPNPSTGNTMINYTIEQAGNVSMNVYDITGKQVMTFDQGHQGAGRYTIDLNTSELNAGVYFYTLILDGKQTTRRMVVGN